MNPTDLDGPGRRGKTVALTGGASGMGNADGAITGALGPSDVQAR
jgi:hypothetical protein